MQNSFKKVLGIFLILLLLPAAAFATDTTDTAEEEAEPFYLLDYFEGTVLDLTQYEGKTILLNFFYEGCPYCMGEMDDIKQVFDTYDPANLAIVLVHVWFGEDEENTASVVSKYDLQDLTIVEDEDLALYNMLGLLGCPTNIFIDQDGYYLGYAYALDYDNFSEIFDSLGVPKRDGVSSGEPTPTPVPAASAIDTTTGATPKR